MDQQADPSAGRRLLDLPESCLHHIVSFMDSWSRLQFFRTSKGSQDEPGCAVLVLRASKLTFKYIHYPKVKPSPALARLVHWAAQISADMQLDIRRDHKDAPGVPVLDVLHSLLVYPQARITRSGHVLGKPATYSGITTLRLWDYGSACLIPDLVADAFPNLKSFHAVWVPDPSQPLGPVLQGGLPHLQHVVVGMSLVLSVQSVSPAAAKHVAQQLSHMPSLTSMDVNSCVFQAVSPAVLAKLKKLQLYADGPPTAQDKAALKACSQLESLTLTGHQAGDWVQALPVHAPSIRTLDASINMADRHLSSLLALPQLTSLTVEGLRRLSDDYSSAPCNWKHFKCYFECTAYSVTKLPLHALDYPITCKEFALYLSDPAADLAAIRAAKPHLLRCGGIQMPGACTMFTINDVSTFTRKQAEEVLAEWAPCLPAPKCIGCLRHFRPIVRDAVTQLWPGAQFDYWGYPPAEDSDDVVSEEEGSDEGLFEEDSDDVTLEEEGSDEG